MDLLPLLQKIGRNEIDPTDRKMSGARQAAPGLVANKSSRYLYQEEHQLDGPGPEEDVDEGAGTGRTHQSNGEPDPHSG